MGRRWLSTVEGWTFCDLGEAKRMEKFMFATGIENSYPTILLPNGKTYRVDEMDLTGHYQKWETDFKLVKSLGINFLRYGPPIHLTHIAPEKYDWSFCDQTFPALKEMGITPIVDLCHFGVPDWAGGFQNPDWPKLFGRYAQEFAKRYPWTVLFTPVNEIFVAATFSASYGWWNERMHSDRAFVTALRHLCEANTIAMREILKVQPKATFIQSESSEYFHAEEPSCEPQADFLNERRFLALDLTYGFPISADMYEFLLDNGMTREQYRWFSDNHVKARCVMGNDYYITNEHRVHADRTWTASGEIFGYYVITRQYFERYHLPVMHTETNVQNAEAAPAWLNKEWANMHRLKKDGVPVLGFTWYSLTDQVDWDTALREKNGRVNAVGLFDLDRNIRPVGKAYQKLIATWRKILPTETYELQLVYM